MLKNEYWAWDQAVPKNVCEAILNNLNWDEANSGVIKNKESFIVDETTRSTDVIWCDQISVIGALAQTYIGAANANAGWDFLINGLERIQMGRYNVNGHYDWHRDTGVFDRKLSISILLNDPSEFEGGELEIETMGGTVVKNLLPMQGSIIVFPSFLKHRVTPVISGTRYTAVGWANGPQFR